MESHEGQLVLRCLEDGVSDQFRGLQTGTARTLLDRGVLLQSGLQSGLQHGEVQLGVLSTEALTQSQQEVDLLLLNPVAPERYKLTMITMITGQYNW